MAVILAISGLIVIGLHPVAATLIPLIFGYVAWSLMIALGVISAVVVMTVATGGAHGA